MSHRRTGSFHIKRSVDKPFEAELTALHKNMAEIKTSIENWYATLEKLESEMPPHLKISIANLYETMKSNLSHSNHVDQSTQTSPSPYRYGNESPEKASVPSVCSFGPEDNLSVTSTRTLSEDCDLYAESKEKAKKFEWKVMPMACSPRGEYFLLDGSENWGYRWKRMLTRGCGTHWCTPIMLPKEYGSHVAFIALERVADDLKIMTWYHYSTPSHVPCITIEAIGILRIHQKENLPSLLFQRKASITLVHSPDFSLMFMFTALPWSEFDEKMPPSMKLRILPSPLEGSSTSLTQ
jgi:hypothetical protein